MSRFIPTIGEGSFKDKVVIITGGSNGIGAATVERLCALGAKVVFGDIESSAGEKQAQKLSAFAVTFVRTDVTKYEDLIALFDRALKSHGRVDCAISNAGVVEIGNWVDPDLDLESIKKIPDQRTLDVNLLGTLYFTRIAAVYLRQGQAQADDKSIILLSSVAGFKESPGMPVYQASKHGVLGLMRSLRLTLPRTTNIRINAICPWFVATGMTAKLAAQWEQHGLPVNEPAGVAEIIVGVVAAGDMNGKAIYVEGNRGWEIEGGIDACARVWMGERQNGDFHRGNTIMEMVRSEELDDRGDANVRQGECWQI